MAQLPIPYGAIPNDPNQANDIPLRTAFQRTHDNFTDLYALQSRTVNAGDVRFAGQPTAEAKIQAAIDQAVLELATAVYVPAFMLPYNASLVTFNTGVRMIREGGGSSVYDLRAYGARDDGSVSAVASLQAAGTAAVLNGGPIHCPPGTFLLDASSSFQASHSGATLGKFALEGAGAHLTTLLVSVPDAIVIGNATANLEGCQFSNLTVRLAANLGYTTGVIHLKWVRGFSLENILFQGGPFDSSGQYGGYLLDADSSYNGVLSNVASIGRKVFLFDINGDSVPSEQMDTITVLNARCTSVYGAIIRQTTGNIHNVTFQNFKHVLTSDMPEDQQSVETTLSSSPSAGATSFTVTSAAGLATGDLILVGKGTTVEVVEIGSLAGSTVTCSALRFAHSAGELVLHGGVGVSVGANTFGITLREPHFERSACGVLLDGGKAHWIENPYSGARDMVRIAGDGVQELHVLGGSYNGDSGANNIVRVLTAGDGAGLSRLMLLGPFTQVGATAITPYTNDAGTTTRQRRTINRTVAGVLTDELVYPSGISGNFETVLMGGTQQHARTVDGAYDARLEYRVGGTKVVGARGSAVADATGGATVDTEARAAINALLARLRTHGLIAP